jgi:hypothetical protein
MAAPTITLIKSTQYTAVYRIVSAVPTVDPALIDYSDAPTLAALVPGPYRYQVKKMLGSLAALNLDSTDRRARRIRIYRVMGIGTEELDPAVDDNYIITWVANGLQVTLGTAAESGPQNLFIEIRFIHSSRR